MKKLGFAFLLARKGSKGLERKNIRPLGGKPLIEWTLDYLHRSPLVDRICISTDDEIILEKYDSSYSNKIISHHRPEELCGDLVTTEEVLLNICETLSDEIEENHFGIYMQITEPFRPKEILEDCYKKYCEGNYDSVFAATAYHKNFWQEDDDNLIRVNSEEQFNSPRQIKKPVIREDTGICLVADVNLFSKGRRIGDRPGYVFYNHFGSYVDIHSEGDLAFAESLLSSNSLNI